MDIPELVEKVNVPSFDEDTFNKWLELLNGTTYVYAWDARERSEPELLIMGCFPENVWQVQHYNQKFEDKNAPSGTFVFRIENRAEIVFDDGKGEIERGTWAEVYEKLTSYLSSIIKVPALPPKNE